MNIEKDKSIIFGKDLTLDEWLHLISIPKENSEFHVFPDFCFPTDELKDEYISQIKDRDPEEVRSLIRAFLIPSGVLGSDFDRISSFLDQNVEEALKIEQVRRMIRDEPIWEGITWVLDLLHRPRMAIEVIRSYLAAHFWWLPDGRATGFFHAMNLIRAAYLEPIHPRDELLLITPRDFELVVGLLFENRKYDVKITKSVHDGGYDVRLSRDTPAQAELSVVECKRYTKNVGVKEVRSLLGVVERENATRGLLITTSSFTRPANSEARLTNRIELIDYDSLCSLFNESFGPNWLAEIDGIVSQAQRQFVV